jgi:methyl-accepting chemotaxis protein
MLTITALYLTQEVLAIYKPPLTLNHFGSVAGGFLTSLFILPLLVTLLVIPNFGQQRLLHIQNQNLAQALQSLQLRQLSSQQTSEKLVSLVADLRSSSSQQAAGSQQQAANLVEVDETIQNMASSAASIAEVALQIKQASEAMMNDSESNAYNSSQAVKESEKGSEAVAQTIQITQAATQAYQQLLDNFAELRNRNAQVQRILELLASLASETNLLSLNAAIEAAGAGIYGERFSIVAQEVRTLAMQTTKASQEVVEIVQKIEEANAVTLESTTASYHKTLQTAEAAKNAGDAIERMREVLNTSQQQSTYIIQQAQTVKQLSNLIEIKTAQQYSASGQVVISLSDLRQVAQQNATVSKHTSAAAYTLEEMAQNLNLTLAN